MLTFHHFTSPRWIAAAGGWEEPRTAERFARFCERSMRHLGDLVPYACTLNEPNLGGLLHGVLGLPGPAPGGPIPFQNAWSPQAVEVMRTAHRLAVEAIKGARASTRVGLTVAMTAWEAAPEGEQEMARLRADREDAFLESSRATSSASRTTRACASAPTGRSSPGPVPSARRWATCSSPRRWGPRSAVRSR